MDCPEYFLYELSGMEMLRERLDFLRFKLRFLTDLFETGTYKLFSVVIRKPSIFLKKERKKEEEILSFFFLFLHF